jgi:hypothetical protein
MDTDRFSWHLDAREFFNFQILNLFIDRNQNEMNQVHLHTLILTT